MEQRNQDEVQQSSRGQSERMSESQSDSHTIEQSFTFRTNRTPVTPDLRRGRRRAHENEIIAQMSSFSLRGKETLRSDEVQQSSRGQSERMSESQSDSQSDSHTIEQSSTLRTNRTPVTPDLRRGRRQAHENEIIAQMSSFSLRGKETLRLDEVQQSRREQSEQMSERQSDSRTIEQSFVGYMNSMPPASDGRMGAHESETAVQMSQSSLHGENTSRLEERDLESLNDFEQESRNMRESISLLDLQGNSQRDVRKTEPDVQGAAVHKNAMGK